MAVDPVYSASITEATAEAPEKPARTSAKDPRINLAVSRELFDYAKIMAGFKTQTLNAFIVDMIQRSYDENKELYEKVLEFRQSNGVSGGPGSK